MLKKSARNRRGMFCKVAFVWALLLVTVYANAQLKAGFKVNKHGGCSPLVVSFSSTSTGTSATTVYEWNFDNGTVASGTVTPSATYYEERSYIVTLTVTDGAVSDTLKDTITVYKKPLAAFDVSVLKGCAPLPVTLTSQSAPGDGSIAGYSWDFGDGQTANLTDSQTLHTYTVAQNATVRLTVINSYGCFSSANANTVTIKPGIKVDFEADHPNLCIAPGSVTFTNKSSGPGSLSYEWQYKDGRTDQVAQPLPHLFTSKGIYDVTLVVKSSEGCADSSSLPVNIGSYKSTISLPEQLCTGSELLFQNSSLPIPLSAVWVVNDASGNPLEMPDGLHTFQTPGTYKVTLHNIFPGACADSTTTTIKIGEKPLLSGFLNDKDSVCRAPVTIAFEDTTRTAVKWHWDFGTGDPADVANTQQTSFTYTGDSVYTVKLTIANTDGCMADTVKTIKVQKPRLQVYTENSVRGDSLPYGCPGLLLKFSVNSPGLIQKFRWDFGDGTSSTNPTPSHTFNGPDTFYVKLSYTLVSGCEDSIIADTVITYRKPVADFTSSLQGTICGNTPVQFTNQSDTSNAWYWDFGDSTSATQKNPVHSFNSAGDFTVKLVAKNYYCNSDTVLKANLVTTEPPFPDILKASASCTERGTLSFTQQADGAKQWTWDFGDGSAKELYDSDVKTIKHKYNQSGSYTVSLSTTNGLCISADTMQVSVLVKQQVKLDVDKFTLCGSGDTINIRVSNLDTIYYNFNGRKPVYNRLYYAGTWQYSDGSLADTSRNILAPAYLQSLTHLKTGENSIRLVLVDGFYGCRDTSDFIPLKIKGPLAGFIADKTESCYSSPVKFTDASKPQEAPIKTWIWNYGDNTADTLQTNVPVTHHYPAVQHYFPVLRAIDENGCYGESAGKVAIGITGPKADFYTNDTLVVPGSPVRFRNTSDTAGSAANWQWDFGDHHFSNASSPVTSYDASGIYTVKLIASNPATGCIDSITRPLYIKVKTINASFSYSFDYGGRSCPPVEYSFTNTSLNADSVFWKFGDNSVSANNNNTPKHSYTTPGLYKVVMYAFGKTGNKDSAVNYIEVKGPYAEVKKNISDACLGDQEEVVLSASAKNTSSFVWDFTDGTVKIVADTFATHIYDKPGLYSPRVIMLNDAGCSNSYMLGDIVIDSLSVQIKPTTHLVCDSGTVFFDRNLYSFAADKLNRSLRWHWNFGTGNLNDTSSSPTPSFFYSTPGTYIVTVEVTSPYGCTASSTDTIKVNIKPEALISALSPVCAGSQVLFKDAGSFTSPVSWHWNFTNGDSALVENPLPVTYATAGTYDVVLIKTADNGCIDTSSFRLTVHPNPITNLRPTNRVLCLGNTLQLNIPEGKIFEWTPAAGLSSASIASPLASPDSSTFYHVKVTNEFGCISYDSVYIKVAQPFKITAGGGTTICAGDKIQLNATGADHYLWTGDSLSSNAIANPLVKPDVTNLYSVVGYDSDQCFTDTQHVQVVVHPVPQVHATGDTVALIGSQVPLSASGSNDIIRWSWSPAEYFSCANCQSTILTVTKPRNYTVVATNNYGCSAKDSVTLKLQCTTSTAFIPGSFTPNADGKNDVFYIHGAGIKMIKHMMIFNRWGERIFEKNNAQVNDRSAGWDGTYKGRDVPTGSYVYITQLVCDNDEIFERKGTITIIR